MLSNIHILYSRKRKNKRMCLGFNIKNKKNRAQVHELKQTIMNLLRGFYKICIFKIEIYFEKRECCV